MLYGEKVLTYGNELPKVFGEICLSVEMNDLKNLPTKSFWQILLIAGMI